MIEINQLSLSLGNKKLFEQADTRIARGQRVGLVGRNGVGKSSLMNLLQGNLQEDAGTVTLAVGHDQLASLEQKLPDSEEEALDYVKRGDGAFYHWQQKLKLAERDEDGLGIAECHAALQSIGGYDIDARAEKICLGLGFQHGDLKKSVRSFSGGWQMRLQLARVLLASADLLLLDEPTNHLDIDAIIWLEKWLCNVSSTVIVISHDRDFLDGVCTHVLHLSQQKLKLYTGNYSSFSDQYELQLQIQSREQIKFNAKREHLERFVTRFRAKASKAKQAQSRVKALEKMVEKPGLQRENPFYFEFLACESIAGSVLNMDAAVGYDQKAIVNNVRLSLDSRDRLGLVGRNGEGKTTIMKSIAKQLPLVAGELHLHPKAKLGYFSQQQQDMIDPDCTPMQLLMRAEPGLSESAARGFLGGFDFSGDRVFEPIGCFSGGEKARLALATLIIQKPNILLLDEPTNHMDMPMREAFAVALQSFQGAVILVSHDRFFMNCVVNGVSCVRNGRIEAFDGEMAEYRDAANPTETKNKLVGDGDPRVIQKNKSNQKLIKKLEVKIERLSDKLQDLANQLANSDLYQSEKEADLHACLELHRLTQAQIEDLEAQWMQLHEDDID